jgi:hypothetical protein
MYRPIFANRRLHGGPLAVLNLCHPPALMESDGAIKLGRIGIGWR